MGYAVEGFGAVAQDYISRTCASTWYQKDPLLTLLALKAGKDNMGGLQIGRSGYGEWLRGVPINPMRKMNIQGINSYRPRIQQFVTSNTKIMAARDTEPTVSNPTTNSQSQAAQATALFHWTRQDTPAIVWHTDLERALASSNTADGQGIAVGQVVEESTQVALQEHLSQLSARFRYGTVTNQSVDPWTDYSGLLTDAMGSTTNTYGNVDRNSISSSSPWIPNVVTTAFARDIQQIVQYANMDLRCKAVGNGVNLIGAGSTNYKIFKNQILSRGGVVIQNTADSRFALAPNAKYGVTMEVCLFENAYVVWDPFLDSVEATNATTGAALYSAQPNTVYAFNLDVMNLILHPQRNVTVKPFVDLSDKAQGAIDANQSFVTTNAILAVDVPRVNAVFTNVTG